jgi:dihydrofolate reductase
MPRLRYNFASSLDGYIAASDGSYDWIVHDADIDFASLYASFDYFILGRKTYETMLTQGDQNPLKDRPKHSLIIVSRTLNEATHPNVTIVKGTKQLLELVTNLRQSTGQSSKDIWLFGGGDLAATLLRANVVDSIEVAIMPVILGRGIKMFSIDNGDDSVNLVRKLKLTNHERLISSGILICKYDVEV